MEKPELQQEFHALPPGVCVPWEVKEREFGEILGTKELVKEGWERLDLLAYLYLWWWVHR